MITYSLSHILADRALPSSYQIFCSNQQNKWHIRFLKEDSNYRNKNIIVLIRNSKVITVIRDTQTLTYLTLFPNPAPSFFPKSLVISYISQECIALRPYNAIRQWTTVVMQTDVTRDSWRNTSGTAGEVKCLRIQWVQMNHQNLIILSLPVNKIDDNNNNKF